MTTPSPSIPDPELVDRARAGDTESFSRLVERHQRRIWAVCRQYVGPDEADGVVQDAFVKAFLRLSSFDGRAAFSTWVTRIAINACLDRLRRRRRRGLRLVTDDDDNGEALLDRREDLRAGPERQAIDRQTVTRLAEVESCLPDRQREIFRLRFYSELELAEIADLLQVHVGTVKTQLHRAVHRLRAELGDVR